MLPWLQRLFGSRSSPPLPTIAADGQGFSLTKRHHTRTVAWEAVSRIAAYPTSRVSVKPRLSLFLLAIMLLPAGPLRAQGAAVSADETAVRAVVGSYLHGLKFNDVPSLERAFWPEAKLYFVSRDGHLGQLTQAAWYAGIAQSAGKEEAGDLRIATVEITRDIAAVKVVEEYPGVRYTDYLSLVRFDGEWRIVNKVYTTEKQ